MFDFIIAEPKMMETNYTTGETCTKVSSVQVILNTDKLEHYTTFKFGATRLICKGSVSLMKAKVALTSLHVLPSEN